MARTLHTNVRSYKEPFTLYTTEANVVNGLDLGLTVKTYKMFGLIFNKSMFINDNFNVAYKNTIAIRIIRPNYMIKIDDKIQYKNVFYTVISIGWDLYSRNEIELNCEYLDKNLWPNYAKNTNPKNNT